MIFNFFENKKKVVIAMAHIGALPGAPLYNPETGMAKLIDDVAADVEKLQNGGVDAIMFGNENDRPYVFNAPPESLAAMTTVITTVKGMLKVPFGVNYLWDPVASVAIAMATEAQFVREIFTGVFASDMGLWAPNCTAATLLRERLKKRTPQKSAPKFFFNINAEFAASLDHRPIELRAQSAVFSSLADAILVSGPITGQSPQQNDLIKVCAAVTDVPVFCNTGVTLANVEKTLAVAAGCIIGTHFKIAGNTWNPVDPERVKRFMDFVTTLR